MEVCMTIEICIGSSCHLKGSKELVDLFSAEIEKRNLKDKIKLKGSFCKGKCNREGVTIQVDDDIYIGITPDKFDTFFNEKVLPKI